MAEELGMTVKKEDFNEWYNEVIQKAELADHSPVSGCMIIRPRAYSIWENISDNLDSMFKERNVENAYFPIFIPENLLEKESNHIEGFVPEVAWVTQHGDTELEEKIAIRPTSETIMYQSFSDWIRSHRDLPMKINQWSNVVRWEFKHAKLFLRTREFLWQEGHTAFEDKKEAEKDVEDALEDYRTIMEDYLAVPVTKGTKTEKEKFAGADYSRTLEVMMPDGKVIQAATSHHLGQNFSKVFDITYLDEDEEEKNPYQNSWGFTTRSIGIMIAVHGDDKGLIIPPKIAPTQVVIVPIYRDDSKEEVMKKANELYENLSKKFRAQLDDRDQHNPGFKFNEWEMKGVPLRIEIGPRDIENKQVMGVHRVGGKKESIPEDKVIEHVEKDLEKIHEQLFERAEKMADNHTFKANNYKTLKEKVQEGRVLAPWCGDQECEDKVKDETGAKISCIVDEDDSKCAHCEKDAKHKVYFARSY